MSYDYTVEGITYPEFNITFALSDDNITDTDALEGLAVEQDTAHANSVKLATNGGKVIGFITTAENGKSQGEGITVTVATKGGRRVKTSAQLAVGNSIVGAGNGAVKAADSANDTVVWEVINATTAVVFQK